MLDYCFQSIPCVMSIRNNLNKVLNADCISFMPTLPAGSVDLLLTDIPYDAVNRKGGIRNYDKGDADRATFDLIDFLDEAERVVCGTIYIFCSTEQAGVIRAHMDKSSNWKFVRHCNWLKTNPSPVHCDKFWMGATEQCIAAKKSGATFNSSYAKNVWEFSCGSSKRFETEKSLDLFKMLVNVSSNPGDVVLDPCAGSGTTAEAAASLKRNFICSELSERACKLARSRARATLDSMSLFLEQDDAGVRRFPRQTPASSSAGQKQAKVRGQVSLPI